MNRRYMILVLILYVTLGAIFTKAQAQKAPYSVTSTRPVREAAVEKAIAWLHTQYQAGNIQYISTCDVARVVALWGENPEASKWSRNGNSLLADCEQAFLSLPRKDAGEGAKALRAAIAAGKDPRDFAGTDLIRFIENAFDPTTGFYHNTNLFRNNLAIIALGEAGRPIPQQAIDALLGQRHEDGCWGWPIGGTITDTDTTGLALEALAHVGTAGDDREVVRCIATLIAEQNEDGGWEARWVDEDISNVDSTALVIEGLVALGWDPESPNFTKKQTAVASLLSFQAEDGAFWWRHDQPGTLLLGTTQSIQPLLAIYPGEIAKPFTLYQPQMLRNR